MAPTARERPPYIPMAPTARERPPYTYPLRLYASKDALHASRRAGSGTTR
jgi:hypothetical protein